MARKVRQIPIEKKVGRWSHDGAGARGVGD